MIDNVALMTSGHEETSIWFSSVDLQHAYSQIPPSKKLGGGNITGSYNSKQNFMA